ncbi:MAG: DPP IV N-terminal domain-containing protein, partial [Paramuribaculum sp.]|nr:DPP IV N-terminal domain-containing protein [Paramuribaculum sp.]
MNHISHFITMAMVATASIGGPAQAANNISAYEGLEKYTGAARYPAAPRALNYTADGSTYLQMSEDGKRIVKHDTRTGKELETLMDLTHTRETTLESIQGYQLSPDGSKILVYRNRRSIYRRSFDAEYYVYEIRSRILKPLSTDHPRQRAATFSPNGRMVAFVADNNIYLRKIDYWTEVAVTTDGSYNRIINGVPDWTYEEEFSTAASMTWSPDNRNLCFLRYDETEVPLYSFPLYEGACDAMKQYALYPGEFTYKYPVAGQKNSVVTVHSYDVETRKVKKIDLPGLQTEYIPRITYAYSPDRLIIVTLNRNQTRMEIFSANPMSTVVKSLLVEESADWLSTDTCVAIH